MESSVKCFPTYVRNLPNGSEEGKFLSLDLGGTNFRVIVMELTKDKEFLMDNKIYAIPRSIMEGNIRREKIVHTCRLPLCDVVDYHKLCHP